MTMIQATLEFINYDESILDLSWEWLNDEEIKKLTMTPDMTRENQWNWFLSLSSKTDYFIKAICIDSKPIGACGLKHITQYDAEYWGYIGEKSYWGKKLGVQIADFCILQAKQLNLQEVYLFVSKENSRAIKLYTRYGFTHVKTELENIYKMSIKLV